MPPAVSTAPTAVTSVAGLVGGSSNTNLTAAPSRRATATGGSSEGTATLIVDKNRDGSFIVPTQNDKNGDAVYTAPIINGSFSFENIAVDDNASVALEALLTVEKDGFAPYTKVINLVKDDPVSVVAEMKNPVMTEVVDLKGLSKAQRMSSFVRFGTKRDAEGTVQSFAKLMSLSELRALDTAIQNGEVDMNGTQSVSVIPTSAIPESVTTLQVDMQSFDSSNPDEFAAFPGKLKGHGYGSNAAKAAASNGSNEVDLESAAFDLLKLTDQNGDLIELQPVTSGSKLAPMASGSCSGMVWKRYLRGSELQVIARWGDDDNETAGYQVPIWSNDNATGAWEFVTEATIHDSSGNVVDDINTSKWGYYFEACVDVKWQGYLNCDSPIAPKPPKQLCIFSHDQFGDALGGVSISGRYGGQYAYGYTSNRDDATKGHTAIEIKNGDAKTDWSFKYRHALTGWSQIAIDPDDIVEVNDTARGCFWDLNITIENPYTTTLTVYPYDRNGSRASKGENVHVYNYTYGSDYFSQYRQVDENGSVSFKIKPDVNYTVTYKAASVTIKANSIVEGTEILDTTRQVDANITDVNKAPSVYVTVNSYRINDASKYMRFYISARDGNYDPLTFKGLKIDSTALKEGTDYIVDSTYSYDGYYYIRGKLNLQSATLSSLAAQLAAGDYTLRASFSDGRVEQDGSRSFTVSENTAPVIRSLRLIDVNTSLVYYSTYSNIPEGSFNIFAYVYDRDGDKYNVTYLLDGNTAFTPNEAVRLAKGDHNISVTAVDENNNSNQKAFSLYVGNHPPRIYSYGTSDSFITGNETFYLYAYASDPDYDTLTLHAYVEANSSIEYNLTRSGSWGAYRSGAIDISTLPLDGNNSVRFALYANDGEDNSSLKYVVVRRNENPIIHSLTSRSADLNTSTPQIDLFTGDVTFECNASDPEGTRVWYRWKIDDTIVSYYSLYPTMMHTFSGEGNHTVTCIVTDADGGSSSEDLNISVTRNDPPVFTKSLSDLSIVEDTQQQFECVAHDPEERGPVSYTWAVNGTTQTDANGTTLSYLFANVGTYTVACTATDVDGLSSTSSATVVVRTNQPPIIQTPLSNVTLDVNETHTFECNASDPEGGSVSYSWLLDSTPRTETTASLTLTFSQAGTHILECRVSDESNNTNTSSANIIVRVPNQPPVVSDQRVSVDGNASVSGTVSFRDPDGNATIRVVGTAPTGFSIDADTGAFTFDASQTYAQLPKGVSQDISVYLVVTDNDGAQSYATLLITVNGVGEASACNGNLKSTVETLLESNTSADVADAKNLVNQLREAQTSFIDLNDTNNSTVVATQATLLKNNIEPRLDAIAADLNGSVARLENCALSFEASVKEDLNTTLAVLTARIDAIGALFDRHDENETWEENTSFPFNDNVKHTYSKSGTTVTEVVTINGDSLTTVWEDTEDGEVDSVTTSGAIEFSQTIDSENSYRLDVTTLDFQNNQGELNASGRLYGKNSASAVLKELYMSFDINQSVDNPTAVSNIDVRFDGTVTAGGRTLNGKLTLSDEDASKNIIDGDLSCTNNEPSFTGKIVLNIPLQAFKEVARDSDAIGNVEAYAGLVMVTFDDNTTSMATQALFKEIASRSESDETTGDYNGTRIQEVTFMTQADRNLTCTINRSWSGSNSYSSTTHTVTCTDGNVTPYYGYDKVITLTTIDGKEHIVDNMWLDYQWVDENRSIFKPRIWLQDEGEVYVDENGTLVHDGTEFKVASISVRDAKEFKDYTFDISAEGTITDGSKEITARIGLANSLVKGRSDLYIENLGVAIDGGNYLYADRLAFGMRPSDMAGFIMIGLIEGNDYWMYNSVEDYKMHSIFESYQTYYEFNNNQEWEEPTFDQFITAIDAQQVSLAVTDTNGSTLSFEGNLTARRTYGDVNASASFSGNYSYSGASFSGIIDVNATRDVVKDELATLSACVEGRIAANGFEPFSISASETFAFGQTEGYLYLTRGTSPLYEIGISVTGNVNSTVTVRLADSNGVKGTYSVDANTTAPSVFNLTNSAGTTLATFGKDSTGNNWEVRYSDGTSETLY